jgi:predicted nucleotidyltransferase
LNSVEIKSVDEPRVRRCMQQYAEQLLSTNPDVEELVVFGSFADGTYAPGSDIDVLIILRSSDKPVWDRIAEFLPGAFPVGLDLFPYTRAELALMETSPMTAAFRRSRWHYQRMTGASKQVPGGRQSF